MRFMLPLALLLVSACSGYTGALGFMARRAVMEDRFEAFDELMEEAAEAEPRGPLDNPKKTVLVHFLDFAGHPKFFDRIDAWRAKGWVSDEMDCAIYRAHYRAVNQREPQAALRSAEQAIDRARQAATNDERAWEVEACLAEAPFLVDGSTKAASRWLDVAADKTEPLPFRTALLDGLTRIDLSGPPVRYGVDKPPTPEERRRWTQQRAQEWEQRLAWIVQSGAPRIEAPLFARATARSVLEVEAVLNGMGRSFVGGYTTSPQPLLQRLPYRWVAAAKKMPRVAALEGLGVWDRAREPTQESFWFACYEPGGTISDNGLGPRRWVKATTFRFEKADTGPECETSRTLIGPYPLESILLVEIRAAVLKDHQDAPIRVRLEGRKTGAGNKSGIPKK